MATPPTRVQLVQPAVGFLSTATPKTTPTFDVVSGDLLVCIGQWEQGGTGSPTLNAPTWTGTGTWVQKTTAGALGNSNAGYVAVWSCAVTATATGRTVSLAQLTTQTMMYGFTVTQWRNHGGVGTTNSTFLTSPSTGAPSLNVSLTGSNSAAQCGSDDWTASDGTTRTWRTVNGSAMTESVYARNTTQYAAYGAYSPDCGAAGTITVGLTVPSAQTYAIAAIEILGTGAAAAIPPILIMQPRRP